jgi:uncharacterized protein with PIN domain
MPRFLADECFSSPMARALHAAGFDILRSAETLPSGDDGSVLALAFREGRVLLTEDTDFGKLTVQLGPCAQVPPDNPKALAGEIVLCPPSALAERWARALSLLGYEEGDAG